jgi:hypothetical protein
VLESLASFAVGVVAVLAVIGWILWTGGPWVVRVFLEQRIKSWMSRPALRGQFQPGHWSARRVRFKPHNGKYSIVLDVPIHIEYRGEPTDCHIRAFVQLESGAKRLEMRGRQGGDFVAEGPHWLFPDRLEHNSSQTKIASFVTEPEDFVEQLPDAPQFEVEITTVSGGRVAGKISAPYQPKDSIDDGASFIAVRRGGVIYGLSDDTDDE